MLYLTALSEARIILYKIIGLLGLINNKLRRTQMKGTVTQFKALYPHMHKVTGENHEKTTVRTAGLRVEIWILDLQNTM